MDFILDQRAAHTNMNRLADKIDVHLQVEMNLLEAWKENDLREQPEGDVSRKSLPRDHQNSQDAAEAETFRNVVAKEHRSHERAKEDEEIAEALRLEGAAIRADTLGRPGSGIQIARNGERRVSNRSWRR